MKVSIKANDFDYQLEISEKCIQNVLTIVCGTIVLKAAIKAYKKKR